MVGESITALYHSIPSQMIIVMKKMYMINIGRMATFLVSLLKNQQKLILILKKQILFLHRDLEIDLFDQDFREEILFPQILPQK